MSAAPWASTNDEAKRDATQRSKPSGMGTVVASAAGLLLLVAGGAVVFLSTRDPEPNDSEIVSAASELSRAASEDQVGMANGAPTDTAAAATTGDTDPAAVTAPTTSAGVAAAPTGPSAIASGSPSSEPTTPDEPQKKIIRRVRPEEPKSAKERLGF
jgi:hypothetical protein